MTYRSEKLKEKLEKLCARQKKIQQEIEETKAAYEQEQNLEAGSVIRLFKLTPREAAELLQSLKGNLPEPEKIMNNDNEEDEEEEEFDEEEETEEEKID